MRYEVGDVLVVDCWARKEKRSICISRMLECDYSVMVFSVKALYTSGECGTGCSSIGRNDLLMAPLLYRGKGEVKVEVWEYEEDSG